MEEYELSETQRTQGEKRDSREDEGKITITGMCTVLMGMYIRVYTCMHDHYEVMCTCTCISFSRCYNEYLYVDMCMMSVVCHILCYYRLFGCEN